MTEHCYEVLALAGKQNDDTRIEDFYYRWQIAFAEQVLNKNEKKDISEIFWKYKSTQCKQLLIQRQNAEIASGIFSSFEDLNRFIQSLIPGSFGLWGRFTLSKPYIAKDDKPLSIFHNPILKESVWKVPMIRGSAWKGVLSIAAKHFLRSLLEHPDNISIFFQRLFQIQRIFGLGSEEAREIAQVVSKWLESQEEKKAEKFKQYFLESFIQYALFELGIPLRPISGDNVIERWLEQVFVEKNNKENPFGIRRGRAVFYPSYFSSVSLECINPHERNRVGNGPIFFEVVPEGETSTFQLVSIPYDAWMNTDEERLKQAKEDIDFLKDLLSLASENGIGAKGKLGWGQWKMEELKDSISGLVRPS